MCRLDTPEHLPQRQNSGRWSRCKRESSASDFILQKENWTVKLFCLCLKLHTPCFEIVLDMLSLLILGWAIIQPAALGQLAAETQDAVEAWLVSRCSGLVTCRWVEGYVSTRGGQVVNTVGRCYPLESTDCQNFARKRLAWMIGESIIILNVS
jgi:hypothetical protein